MPGGRATGGDLTGPGLGPGECGGEALALEGLGGGFARLALFFAGGGGEGCGGGGRGGGGRGGGIVCFASSSDSVATCEVPAGHAQPHVATHALFG